MSRAVLIVALTTACLGACTSSSPPVPSPTRADETRPLNPCSFFSRDLVERTLAASVTKVGELTADDFRVPPPPDQVACAYETSSRYGQLTLTIEPMTRNEYAIVFDERNYINTRVVAGLGEDARFSSCGGLSVYSKGHILQLGIQFADCTVLPQLASLARIALRQL